MTSQLNSTPRNPPPRDELSPSEKNSRVARSPAARRLGLACLVLVFSCVARAAMGQATAADSEQKEADMSDLGPLNMVLPTLGGKQLWADRLVYFDWRIQRNELTKHYRLLDGNNRRRGWGTFEQCQHRLTKIRRERQLPPMRGKAVLVLHGLFRTRGSMTKMKDFLRKSGYIALTFGYPTTRGTVADHAQHLASVMDHLEEIDEINFVAHSLGNLVIRHYLADHTNTEKGLSPDPRIHRIVMLGPPNQGARMAEHFVPIDITGQVAGPAAAQLATGWEELETQLATPACEFGILAGGNGTLNGRNPLLDGDDDMVVSVASTRLAGATDFRVLPVIHTTMMNNETVWQYTARFLRHGYFQDEARRHPLAEVAAAGGADGPR